MIEFALLFGLGFLTAALLVMLVAPAIQRRIVSYAENRLKATMPLSPGEVRAQRDMARAVFAAEQSKTQQELVQERDRRAVLQAAQEQFLRDAARMESENKVLSERILELTAEAAGLNAALQQAEAGLAEWQQAHASLEGDLETRLAEIEDLRKQYNRAAADRDNLKIDLAARNTQTESDRYRTQTLREERDDLRREVKLLTTRAKEAEQRLEQEEHKALRLSDRLAREQAGTADKEALIERRSQEIGRLREKIKVISTENRKQQKAAPAERKSKARQAATSALGETDTLPLSIADVPAVKDEIRQQAGALADQLISTRSTDNDEALRQQLVSVAANMVAVTALEEGENSPIHRLIGTPSANENGPHPSLADRTRALLQDQS